MKKLITFIGLFLFFAHLGLAQITANSTITEVVIHPSSAQLTRQAKVNIPPGKSKVLFSELSPYLEASTINVSGSHPFTILSVNERNDFTSNASESTTVTELMGSIDELELDIELKQATVKVLQQEEQMIISNRTITGANNQLDVEDLLDYADYYRNHLLTIKDSLIGCQQTITSQQRKLTLLKQSLSNELGKTKSNSKTIEVLVESDRSYATTIQINYLTYGVSWTPNYDIHCTDINSPLTLLFKGSVQQQTGNDWNNVKVSLSSNQPRLSNDIPNPEPWILREVQPNYYGSVSKGYVGLDDNKKIASPLSINKTFLISTKYSIPSSTSKSYDIELMKEPLPVRYEYFSAPRYDQDVFLVAQLSNWEDYNLMSGMANIYLQNNYVGQSWIDAQITTDTLELSLGRDKAIIVDRTKVKDFLQSGNTTKRTQEFETVVKNTKNKTVELVVQDQIPLSNHKDLSVELVNAKDAQYDEKTGILTWNLLLGPNETRSLSFQTLIKYPGGKRISGL